MLLLGAGEVSAQSSVFRTYQPLSDSSQQTLFFRIESSTFFKNNEYFDSFAYGYTGIGFYAKPVLDYYFTDKFEATAGVYLLKYSGLDDFSQVIPIFRLRYKMAPTLELVMGNIYGTANHRLAEPLFRYDRFYQDHIEYGFQFLLHTSHVWSDLWLSWEHFIQVGDTLQEHLMVGSSTVFTFNNPRKGWGFSIPVQVVFAHKGGQLAPPPHKPVSTIMNTLAGVQLQYRFNPKISLAFEPEILYYAGLNLPDPNEINGQPFNDGWGSYTKLSFRYGPLKIMTGYWYAKRFISPHGEYLFQSVSEIDPAFSQEKRELLTSKISFHKTIYHSIKLEARFESYYDLMSHELDYSYGLYIVMNESFFLLKYKH
ncbi:hypothetical protein LA303_11575 [Candidatus Sulfidibacterium hydrothermale]|uniref:hypothetical protein n=1 Tax=Candidatus Sulfidibacterium hydrothermale TaxID=2875962 RepID=UPI001F0B512E|nr:hypothetical protein [Candidatus Sulfidibacterium hydrothermale]UBM62029.1 hypothetical protein LA303_11575 [Candidatus Sulfidibacterium hydrothermale]